MFDSAQTAVLYKATGGDEITFLEAEMIYPGLEMQLHLRFACSLQLR